MYFTQLTLLASSCINTQNSDIHNVLLLYSALSKQTNWGVKFFKKFLNYIFKTKLVRSTLRTVAVKLLYSPTRFV